MRVDFAERARTRRQGEAPPEPSADEAEFRMLETLQTACQQACPTAAIVFGDANQPGTTIAKIKTEPHDYGLLSELTTRPRTTYLARVRNPNPALEPAPNASTGGAA